MDRELFLYPLMSGAKQFDHYAVQANAFMGFVGLVLIVWFVNRFKLYRSDRLRNFARTGRVIDDFAGQPRAAS